MKSFSLYEHCVMLPYDNKIKENSLPFSCGNYDLDDFFQNESELYEKELLGKTYCWITESRPHRIVALFTLANDSIKTINLDKSTRNRFNRNINNSKRGRSYPATLIGRIGVNKSLQGFNIGSQLIDFIKKWFRHEDNKIGCRFLVVDAYNNPRTLKFYENNNFKYLYGTEEEEELYFKTTMTRMMYFDLKK